MQSFDRDFAKSFGHACDGFDISVVVNAEEIREKYDVMSDHLGEVRTLLPTMNFQVDLIEPGRYDLVQKTIGNSMRIVEQKLIERTFPWCLITIFDSGVD